MSQANFFITCVGCIFAFVHEAKELNSAVLPCRNQSWVLAFQERGGGGTAFRLCNGMGARSGGKNIELQGTLWESVSDPANEQACQSSAGGLLEKRGMW